MQVLTLTGKSHCKGHGFNVPVPVVVARLDQIIQECMA